MNNYKINKIRKLLIKKKNIQYSILIAIFVLSVSLIIIAAHNYNNLSRVKVYYRTYTKEKGWTKWAKNGETSGNGIDPITNIEIKTKTRLKGGIVSYIYQKDKWSIVNNKNKNKKISGFKATIYDDLYYEYNVYYRTYNKKDKWLEWSFDNNINGNKKEPITKIQIKALHSDITLEDYLKDYRLKEVQSVGFEKVGDNNE